MNTIEKIEGWGNAHRPGWLDIFRIVLGLFITFKGFEFMFNIESLEMTTAGLDIMFSGAVVAHYVILPMLLVARYLSLDCLRVLSRSFKYQF
ncbi:MAG: hypothetical protein HC811_02400 [Flammeovirgaceae bacterium]|nr:hypothetical protein [Flammeovirgaceae bacterium]